MINIEAIGAALQDCALVIDAGHGWNTPGKRSFNDELRENEFNSAVQDKIGIILDLAGVEYILNANGWADVSPDNRVAEINEYVNGQKAKRKKCIGVSVHADAFHDEDAHGFTVFYYKRGETVSAQGKLLAKDVNDAMNDRNQQSGMVTKNRGIKGANFYILRRTTCPFVLVEAGFMTNDDDLRDLLDDGYRNDVALAIIEGLCKYANS